jgi:RHS repeat-associated protein
LGIDEPLTMYRSGAGYAYHADGLGSIGALTDASGNIPATYVYDSFGNQTSSTGSVFTSFRYTARELDGETSLYYYRARYYLPGVGRFTSEDPVRYAGGRNFYVYVGNDPTSLLDPLGLKPCTLPIVPKDPSQRKAPVLSVCPSQSLVDCLVQTESGGDSKAVSNKGAKGKWQVMPSAVAELQEQSLIGDKYDLDQVGLLYLKLLLTSCDTTENAVAAYNAGPTAVNKAGGLPNIKETKEYVQRIGDCLKGKGVAKGLQDPAATCPCTK